MNEQTVSKAATDASGSASEVPSPPKSTPAAAKAGAFITPEKAPAFPILARPVVQEPTAGASKHSSQKPAGNHPSNEEKPEDGDSDSDDDAALCLDRNGIKNKLQE